ncbi:hypothetical protein PanWU01x14_252910, partial [Parasponia andersonii]
SLSDLKKASTKLPRTSFQNSRNLSSFSLSLSISLSLSLYIPLPFPPFPSLCLSSPVSPFPFLWAPLVLHAEGRTIRRTRCVILWFLVYILIWVCFKLRWLK